MSEWVRGTSAGLAALLLALVTLLVGYLCLAPVFYPQLHKAGPGNGQDQLTVNSGTFIGRTGSYSSLNGSTHISGLTDGRALFTRHISLEAKAYPLLRIELKGVMPKDKVYFIWRKTDETRKIYSARLQIAGDNKATIMLDKSSHWTGNISEIGLDIYSTQLDGTIIFSGFTFLTATPLTIMEATLTKWQEFPGWTHESINHLAGDPDNGFPSIILSVVLWTALALTLLAVCRLLIIVELSLPILLISFAAWFAIDIGWQNQLAKQISDSATVFAGLTSDEKFSADQDSALYKFAKTLKTQHLPSPGARIIMLHDSDKSEGHVYPRLRLQYHLLPHNVHNFRRWPPSYHLRPGDYILILNKVAGLNYSTEKQSLSWGERKIKARVIFESEVGSLYLHAPNE